MLKMTLLFLFIFFDCGIGLSTTIIAIKGSIVNEKNKAPVYKAEVYILDTDLTVESSEIGNFNFLVSEKNLPDTITLLVTRYEFESITIRLPLARLNNNRPVIWMTRYFRTPEVLNWPNLLVSGKVTDKAGNPLHNVAIYASGTTGFTYSDASGKFTLKVEQMRPDVQPALWFCKKGYKTKQIGLSKFKKQKVIHLVETKGQSQSITIKYQNADRELLESVNVVLGGKIYDRTGVLGTVTLGIEADVAQSIRISQAYRSISGGKRHQAVGSISIYTNSLKPELTFVLSRNNRFILVPEFENLAVINEKQVLPEQDSLLITRLEPIPDPQLDGSTLVKLKSSGLENNTTETGKAMLIERFALPIIDLPDIHITVTPPDNLPISATPIRNEQFAQLISDSFEAHQGNPRSAETLNKAIREHNLFIQGCYKDALKKNPDLKGSLELRFVLNADGEIDQAEIISSTLAEPEMEQHIIEKIKRWHNFQSIDPTYGKRTYKLKYNFGNF
jgi:hypothetical protein